MLGLQRAMGDSMPVVPQQKIGLGSLGKLPSALEYELNVRFATGPEAPHYSPRTFD
jgi:hypothetical protein